MELEIPVLDYRGWRRRVRVCVCVRERENDEFHGYTSWSPDILSSSNVVYHETPPVWRATGRQYREEDHTGIEHML